MTSKSERQKGYALLLVLWSLLIISLLSAMLIAQNRFAVRLEANSWVALEDEQLAETAFAIAILELYEAHLHQNGLLHGAPVPFSFEGIRGEITIQDELGKVDINAASVQILRTLLRSADATPSEVETLASRISEWRGGENSGRPYIIVKEEYQTEQLPYSPRGSAFQSVDELRLILGMDDQLFRTLRPSVTIFTHSATFDPNAASEMLLRAASGISPATVQNILERRSNPTAEESDKSSGNVNQRRIPLEGRAVAIEVEFVFRNRHHHFQKIVRISGSPDDPIWVLE